MTDADRAKLPIARDRLQESMRCDQAWLANRLTVLWLTAGYRKGEAQATAWLGEMVRLLSHVPTDIAAAAIDDAVKASERGYLPSVGEILKIAGPALDRRRSALRQIEKLIATPTEQPTPVKPVSYCEPKDAERILAEAGIRLETARRSGPLGPLRTPTAADYAAMGITPEMLEASRVAAEAEKLAPPKPIEKPPETAIPDGSDVPDRCSYCGEPGVTRHGLTLFCDGPTGCGRDWCPEQEQMLRDAESATG